MARRSWIASAINDYRVIRNHLWRKSYIVGAFFFLVGSHALKQVSLLVMIFENVGNVWMQTVM